MCSDVFTPSLRLGIGQKRHGLDLFAFGAPRNSLLRRLICNVKFVKLHRGITSHCTLKRAKMQTSTLDSYQYNNNTIILFATQYKNDNSVFNRSSAVSGGLALLRVFCQC